MCEGGDGGAEAICKAEGPQGQPELDGSHIGFGSDLQRKREVGKGGRLIWHKLDRAKPVSEPDRSPCTQWPHRPTILPSAPKVLASLFWLVLKEGF